MGRGGADRLQGGMGRDRIYSGEGDDTVYADRDLDEDYVDCGPGLDRIKGYFLAQDRDFYLSCERWR